MSKSVGDLLDLVAADTPTALAEAVTEAARLRREVSEAVPSPSAGPEDLHKFLMVCRGLLDRVEELQGQVLLFRGRVEKALAQREGAVEDAEVAAYQGKLTKGDYTSAKERSVEFALHSLDEKRKVRAAQILLGEVRTAYEYIKMVYWGIDGTRKETDTRLRAITLASALER